MSVGAGKYDDLCGFVREQAGAQVACVIVLGGDKGSGFSMQGSVEATMTVEDVAAILEQVAATLRADVPEIRAMRGPRQ